MLLVCSFTSEKEDFLSILYLLSKDNCDFFNKIGGARMLIYVMIFMILSGFFGIYYSVFRLSKLEEMDPLKQQRVRREVATVLGSILTMYWLYLVYIADTSVARMLIFAVGVGLLWPDFSDTLRLKGKYRDWPVLPMVLAAILVGFFKPELLFILGSAAVVFFTMVFIELRQRSLL